MGSLTSFVFFKLQFFAFVTIYIQEKRQPSFLRSLVHYYIRFDRKKTNKIKCQLDKDNLQRFKRSLFRITQSRSILMFYEELPLRMHLSSNLDMNMFVHVRAHIVPIAQPLI